MQNLGLSYTIPDCYRSVVYHLQSRLGVKCEGKLKAITFPNEEIAILRPPAAVAMLIQVPADSYTTSDIQRFDNHCESHSALEVVYNAPIAIRYNVTGA